MLYSQYGEITYFVLFCRGLRRPAFHPPLFYADAFLRLPCHGVALAKTEPRRRVRPGAMRGWRESVSGWVRQAVFRRNFRFVLPHIKAGGTLRNDETNLSPDFAIIGGEQALFLYAVTLTYPVVKIHNELLPRR